MNNLTSKSNIIVQKNKNIIPSKGLKRKFPKNKIFRINSLIFNAEKQCINSNKKY